MKRSGFRKIDYAEALQKALEKRKHDGEKPVKRQSRLKAGRRMKQWASVWRWLKPRLEAAGRTHCEFDFIPHECFLPLTPAHSKKRREIVGDEIYEVAIACTVVHWILDEKYTHEQMYVAVMYAIERAGGLITPAIEAARKKAA